MSEKKETITYTLNVTLAIESFEFFNIKDLAEAIKKGKFTIKDSYLPIGSDKNGVILLKENE